MWIALIAFALIGIVTLQLGLLKLNGDIGRALVQEALVRRENATLSIENSELASSDSVESRAARIGMEFAPSGALRFLAGRPYSEATDVAAALSIRDHTPATSSGEAAGTGTAPSAAGAASSTGTGLPTGTAPAAGTESPAAAESSPAAESAEAQPGTSAGSSAGTEPSSGAPSAASATSSTSAIPTAPADASQASEVAPAGGTEAAPAGG